MVSLVVRSIGSSFGVILPKEILAKLNCKKGDKLFITETNGGVELSPYDESFANDMVIVEDIISKNKNLLKKLAK
jgi:putative addiction module antidote